MRLENDRKHPSDHAAATNVSADQHHDQPENIEVINTTLSIAPLPGGPGQWDISVPLNAQVVRFAFRSVRQIDNGGAKAGCHGVANRSSLYASSCSYSGSWPDAGLFAFYTKPSGALYLSDKFFGSAGTFIALTDIYLTLTGPSTRVLRTTWTNFGAGYVTLDVRGEVQVIG